MSQHLFIPRKLELVSDDLCKMFCITTDERTYPEEHHPLQLHDIVEFDYHRGQIMAIESVDKYVEYQLRPVGCSMKQLLFDIARNIGDISRVVVRFDNAPSPQIA